MKFCTNCGAQLDDAAVVCPKCGCAADPSFNAGASAADADSGITFHGYKRIDKSNHKIIDFVLVNRFCQSVKSYRILRDKIGGIYPSDHFAVVATLMF